MEDALTVLTAVVLGGAAVIAVCDIVTALARRWPISTDPDGEY